MHRFLLSYRLFRAGLPVACLALGACSYSPESYTGDGTMTALAPASPGYDLEFDPISLTKPGRAEFQLGSLPDGHLRAILRLDDCTPAKLDWIEKAGVQVAMTLTDQQTGRTSVKKGRLLGSWAGPSQLLSGERQDFEGIWFHPARHASYVLTVEVSLDRPLDSPSEIKAAAHVRTGRGGGLSLP